MRKCFVAFLFTLFFAFPPQAVLSGTFIVASDAAQIRLMLELRAQQFLNRATFGAKDADITSLADSMETLGINGACSKWIDDQFLVPTTFHTPTIQNFMAADGITTNNDAAKNLLRYRYHAWWHNAIAAPDQLKQRLAWALIQICVVGEGGDNFNTVDIPTGEPTKPYWFGMSK